MINNKRAYLIQSLLLATVAVCCFYFYVNITDHLIQDNIASGFAFLSKPVGFSIDMHLISFGTGSTYLRAFIVAILNTLLVSLLAIFLSSLLGGVVAHSRLSRNWLLRKLARGYVSLFRNLPLLLLVLFSYFALLEYMPQPDASYKFFGITANVRGITIGTITLIPEFVAMLIALTVHSTSYIAEHIRHALLTIDKGQTEAAIACGFSTWQSFRFIIFPQAARIALRPIITTHVSTLKNSSLGIAIGYPELVSIFEGTVLSTTGQAIEPIFMTMSVYLVISFVATYMMHLVHRKLVIPGK